MMLRDGRRVEHDLGPTPDTASKRPAGVVAAPLPEVVAHRLAQRAYKARKREERAA